MEKQEPMNMKGTSCRINARLALGGAPGRPRRRRKGAALVGLGVVPRLEAQRPRPRPAIRRPRLVGRALQGGRRARA
eukprot:1696894-Alexandrium_andersonii.AAC.1